MRRSKGEEVVYACAEGQTMLTADAVADLTTGARIGGGIGRATLGALLVLRTEVIDLRTEDEIHPRSGWLFATSEEDAPTEDHRRGGSPGRCRRSSP